MKRYILFFIVVLSCPFTLRAQVEECYPTDSARAFILLSATGSMSVIESEFSISAVKKVRFAKGNLLYQPSTGKWRIAPRAYDIVGGNCSQEPKGTHGTIWDSITNPKTHKKVWTRCTNDNTHNATYEGWIDLFPWGTSGWYGMDGTEDPTASIATRNANNPIGKITCNPYETGRDNANYSLGGDPSQGFDGIYANADWGILHNTELGGTVTEVFRVPTQAEAKYILHDRPNALKLRARAHIRIPGTGSAPDTLINGVVILPDDWDMEISLGRPFISDYDGCTLYSDNEFTTMEWAIMEAEGAVFLPAAGGMQGGSSVKCNRSGFYWGATPDGSNSANSFDLQFGGYDSTGTLHSESTPRYYCRAVRLCQEITEPEPEPEP